MHVRVDVDRVKSPVSISKELRFGGRPMWCSRSEHFRLIHHRSLCNIMNYSFADWTAVSISFSFLSFEMRSFGRAMWKNDVSRIQILPEMQYKYLVCGWRAKAYNVFHFYLNSKIRFFQSVQGLCFWSQGRPRIKSTEPSENIYTVILSFANHRFSLEMSSNYQS